MRPAVSAPRSARISASSISSIVASSSWRLATTCAMAPPSVDELRLSPAASRCHQGVAAPVPVSVVSAVPSLIAVSPFVVAVIVGAVRDSGSAMSSKEMPSKAPSKASPAQDMTAEQIVSRLLYRDGLMLVIDKPPGIAVHRGPKGGDSLEDRFAALRFGLPRPPALAHRLDRDTSGCLVLGRHRKALAQLGKLFKSGTVEKTYWAVVEGGPDADEGVIELPLGRLDASRGWWMKHDPTGQPAVTKWRVLG